MNPSFLFAIQLLIKPGPNPNKHPTTVIDLVADLSSSNSHKRGYASRELLYLVKQALKRKDSLDKVESMEARVDLEQLNLSVVPACSASINKGYSVGYCSDILRLLEREETLSTLKKRVENGVSFWDRCALNKAIEHFEKKAQSADGD